MHTSLTLSNGPASTPTLVPYTTLLRSTTNFTGSVSAVDGLHTDTATASGTATDDFGNTVSVSAHDSANYQGVAASIAIDKQIVHGTQTFDAGSNLAAPLVLVGKEVDLK